VAVAFVLYLVLGRHQYFYLDEWDFVVDRIPAGLGDLLRPHNEHWTTLPILAYRGLYRLFGLRTYVPYQVVSVVLHLTVSVLLFAVIRRAGVRPWVATAAAALFVLFGAGSQDIVWAFQMAFTASLAFGLAHLLLADHDGPVNRRDWLGLVAGLAGLMCSGVAVTMVVVVGLAMLLRRGWRVALLHTAPLAAIYCAWWLAEARGVYGATRTTYDLWAIARFVGTGIGSTFAALGQLPGAGIALGLLLVVGLVAAWQGLDRATLRKRAAVPGALLVGVPVFFVITGVGRISAWGIAFASQGRYLHVAAALSLPAVAVAADAVTRRWRVAVPLVMALLLVGIPGNVEALADFRLGTHEMPGWVVVRRTIVQSNGGVQPTDCTVVTRGGELHLDRGESLFFRGGRLRVFDRKDRDTFFMFVEYDPSDGNLLTAQSHPIDVVLRPDEPDAPVTVCPVQERLTGRA
jgi:hypothetical protein